MKKRIFFFTLLLFASSFLFSLQTKAQGSTLNGLNETAGQVSAYRNQLSDDYQVSFLSSKAGQIIGLILSFVGVLFFGLIIYAGIMWMTANGNEGQVTKAKDLILNAVIGIIIVFAAYAVTSFLGQEILQSAQ